MAEAEYISKEAALACFSDWIDRYGHEHTAEEMVEYQKIEDLPAADVRPVIKCKNCRWWTKQEKSLQGRCELGGFYPTGEWFCANGERPNCGADMREVTP